MSGQENIDLILEVLGGQKYDDYAACLCFAHSDTRPSLMVWEDHYKCLTCGVYGKTKDLAQKLSGLPIKFTPHNDFHNPFTQWLKSDNIQNVLIIAYRNNKRNPSVYMRDIRRVSVEFMFTCKIGQRDGWITFPILDERGKIIGAVARAGEGNSSTSKYIIPSGQNPNLLYVPDWSLQTKSRFTFLTFGIIDAVTLCMLGYPAMSTTTGKRLDPTALDSWRKLIFIIPDEKEEAEAGNIAKYLGWRGKMWRVNWPDGCKDISDLWMKSPKLLEDSLRKTYGNVLG